MFENCQTFSSDFNEIKEKANQNQNIVIDLNDKGTIQQNKLNSITNPNFSEPFPLDHFSFVSKLCYAT